MKDVLRLLLALLMVAAGVLHFVFPKGYARIVPAWIPSPLMMVWLSGVAEIALGVGLASPWEQLQRWSAWGLIALFIAVFPANVNMAVNHIGFGRTPPPAWLLWARLPLQAVLIAWAFWFTR